MKNYFKKFSIMFVMFLMFIGIAVIQNGGIIANAATVGQQLLQPEDGWQRIDNMDNKIKYSSNFALSTEIHSYNNNIQNTTSGGTIKFNFVGTKLRIVAFVNYDKSDNHTIIIDNGTPQVFSTYKSSYQGQTLVYEVSNLERGVHSILVDAKRVMSWDAIDIDKDGYLVDSNDSITLNKLSIDSNVRADYQLTATTTPAGAQVIWSSSDSSIATVDSNGKVTGVAAGTATITAQIVGTDIKATCKVTVTKENQEDPKIDGDENLYIQLVNGDIKKYNVTSSEFNEFTEWYKDRVDNKAGSPYYKFDKDSYKDYVVCDKIEWFEKR